jgi:hypothetical protein
MTPPPQGQMYLFDSVTPPLDDGSYRLTATTAITYGPPQDAEPPPGAPAQAPTQQSFASEHFFNVVGPRFTVPQAMVAGTFPPANAHGAFQDDLPHIVLSRRTLPWERELDPAGLIKPPEIAAGDPPALAGPRPWVALLLFEEGEYTLLRNIALQQAVPADVFERLGSPANITCDAVEADAGLIAANLPSLDELQLLAHGRYVNVADRELNTAGGDGYFSVVVANRLPAPNARCRAILVSLEERSDLVRSNPPPAAVPPRGATFENQPIAQRAALLPRVETGAVETGAVDRVPNPCFTLSQPPAHTFAPVLEPIYGFVEPAKVRLVALTSWQFTSEGPGPFRTLMQNLNVAMLGTVAELGHPPLCDTGHLQIALQDRLGASEAVWYRGPLVPYTLTRDALGPYHAADQARRATPETGAEDVSYAAAFEVGRLLAAADARFAQSIMQWRRESYKQSARASTIAAFGARMTLALPATLAETLHTPIAPIAATAAATAVVASNPPIADAYGQTVVGGAVGLNPVNAAAAWNVSAVQATTLLGGDPGTLGIVVDPPAQTARPNTTLGAVAADTAGLDRLSAARTLAVSNATTTLGGA